MLKSWIVFTLHVFLYGHILAQAPRLDPINISNGLSDNTIFDIEVDSLGDVWIATRNGLNKFNGFEFFENRPYRNDNNHLKGNTVIALYADSNDDLWAYTTRGVLNRYNSRRKQFYHYTDSAMGQFTSESTGTLIYTNDSLLWIKSGNRLGYYNLKRNRYNLFHWDSTFNNFCFYDSTSILFYGEFGIKKVVGANDRFEIQLLSELPAHKVHPVDSGFFVANHIGVYFYDREFKRQDTVVEFHERVIQPNVVHALAISENYLWIGFLYGLHRYPLDQSGKNYVGESRPKISQSFLNEHISALKIDKAGNLWIGTTEKGVFHYSNNRNKFQFINWNFNYIQDANMEYHIGSDPVSAICKTNAGELWLGSTKSGIGRIRNDGSREVIEFYYDAEGKRQSIRLVLCILEDSQGTIWFASQGGILYYNKSKKRVETLQSKYGWEWPYQSLTFKEFIPGIITITGDDKIGEINLATGNLEVLPTHRNGVYLWSIFRDMALDDANNLWLVQNNYGLIKIDSTRTTYTRYLKTTSGFSDNKIYALHIQGDTIWLATNLGLNLYSISKNKVLRYYTKEDGLSSDIIYSVHVDERNQLWMSTSRGISRLDISSGTLSTYLLNTFFYHHAYSYQPDGGVLFGGYNNLVEFYPERIQKALHYPSPVISQFHLFNQAINAGDTIDGRVLIENSILQQNKLTLTHKQNSFSFEFNAYPFEYPNNTRFRYRLKDIQKQWVYSQSNSRIASYTAIRPGDYIFQVSASNQTGKWSKPKEIHVSITPPIWQRKEFLISIALLIVISVVLYINYRLNAIKRRNLWLEKRVEEQTSVLKKQTVRLIKQNEEIQVISDKLHKADESKLRFFTNVSHEFRTPLTIILGHLEKLAEEKYNRSITIIRRNAYRLLDLVNQLIEIRKLDQDQLKLGVSKFDIVDFCQSITTSFQVIAEQKDIHFQMYSTFDKLDVWLDRDKVEKILFNLISNAIKYTVPHKNVMLSINATDTDVVISIEDEGIGIAKKDIPFIFERFYRTESNDQFGHGIGLALTKGLVEIQHGSIEVKSKPNEGTTFTVYFKKGNEHFTKKDFGTIKSESSLIGAPNELTVNFQPNVSDKKILLVEDNEELRNYLQDLLQKQYAICSVTNGKEALEILNNYHPDLILSDILMPVIDGIQLCKALKSNIETSHIPIILLTAKADTETQIEGFNLGIDDYIEKPFKSQLLIARIAAILGNRDNLFKYFKAYNSSTIAPESAISVRDKEFWSRITREVEENYNNPDFNTSVLSDKMNMSRASFYRKFKGLTDINAADHIRKYRLHKALDFIHEGETNISVLSLNVGFRSVSQFKSCFKEEFGKSPAELIIK